MAEGGEGPKKGRQLIEKPCYLICGGMEKKEVFQQAILPVLKTLCQSLNCDAREYVASLMKIMFE
jgi:hypothetical protein